MLIKQWEEAMMRQKLGLEPVAETWPKELTEFEIKELTKWWAEGDSHGLGFGSKYAGETLND